MKQPYFSFVLQSDLQEAKTESGELFEEYRSGRRSEDYCSLNKGSNWGSTTHARFSYYIRRNPEINLAEKLSHCSSLLDRHFYLASKNT